MGYRLVNKETGEQTAYYEGNTEYNPEIWVKVVGDMSEDYYLYEIGTDEILEDEE